MNVTDVIMIGLGVLALPFYLHFTAGLVAKAWFTAKHRHTLDLIDDTRRFHGRCTETTAG